jgi:hypothetical protein
MDQRAPPEERRTLVLEATCLMLEEPRENSIAICKITWSAWPRLTFAQFEARCHWWREDGDSSDVDSGVSTLSRVFYAYQELSRSNATFPCAASFGRPRSLHSGSDRHYVILQHAKYIKRSLVETTINPCFSSSTEDGSAKRRHQVRHQGRCHQDEH